MIYCIEDDSAIRDLMVYTLQASGFEARGFESDADFWPAMREQRPELVILDVMLPGEDGLTILRKLRSSPVTADIPVIMATAKDSEYDTVIGLDSGADDYLAKPFGMMEMVSRIRAVLRRSGSKQPMLLSRGIVAMDESKHTVTVNGKAVFLTLKEYELLKLFMENPGRVFTRDNILSIVWGVDYSFETRTVDVHIGTLRTKLENAGDYIQTIRGVGYKLEETNVTLCAEKAGYILSTLGYPSRFVELAKIAGYLHDIGNLVNRSEHSQSGAIMAFRILDHLGFPPDEIGQIVTAIGNHDEGTGVPVSALAAALILADKSDARRSRVRNQDISAFDIHDRVNYSVTKAELKINEAHTLIKLKLTVDTHFSSVMDYFEIFLNRMILCRKAAEKLGLQFKLMINEQQLM